MTQTRGNTACETLTKVLRFDPSNRRARDSLKDVAVRLEAMTQAKQQEDDLHKRLSIVEAGLQIVPDHASLQSLRDDLYRQIDERTKTTHGSEQKNQSNHMEVRFNKEYEQQRQVDNKKKQRRIKSFATF